MFLPARNLRLILVWLSVLLCVVALAVLAIGIILWLPFARSPEKRWRDQVLHLAAATRQWEAIERNRLKALQTRRQADERYLRDRAFVTFLATIAVDQLEEYTGIGPRTIEKLRATGHTSLAQMRNGRIRMGDLGAKRTADVQNAVRDLIQQARARFDAGDWPQAQELADQLRGLAAEVEERELPAQVRVQMLEKVLDQLKEQLRIAEQITWRHYRHARSNPSLFPKIPLTPLPDLVQALATADEEARTDLASRKHEVPGSSPPSAIPVSQPVPEAPMAIPAPPPGPDQQLATLEIHPELPLTADLVRRQYNLLWERYDPGRVEAMGPDFATLARRKRDEVRAAATTLLAQWNEPLELEARASTPRDLRENPDLDALFGA
jgi:hypothetical protein